MDMKLELPKFEEVPMTAELQQLLMEARTNVVLGSSIYAYTMMRCEYIFTRDLPIPTAASCVHDDRNIVFIDPDFFTKILTNRAQRAFVLLHEIDHIFFMHQKHCIDLSYDHETYNRAADYFINLSLSGIYLENGVRKQNQKYRSYFEMPSCGLYDEMFIGWSSDKIYEYLLENPDHGSGSGQGIAGEDGDNGKLFDVFMGNGGSRSQQIKNIQSALAAVAFAEQSNGIGEGEGELVDRIKGLAKPVVDWTERLTALVQSSTKIRPTYNRLSRRSNTSGDGVIFPSYTGNKISVFFGFDTSGSMGESDYRVVAGELQGILTQFDAWDVHLVCCDMSITPVGDYSSEDGDTFEDVQLNIRGGGGTLMGYLPKEACRRMEEEGVVYDAIIVVTDGHIDVPDLDNAFPKETTNIVVTTRNHGLEFKNAESISIKA